MEVFSLELGCSPLTQRVSPLYFFCTLVCKSSSENIFISPMWIYPYLIHFAYLPVFPTSSLALLFYLCMCKCTVKVGGHSRDRVTHTCIHTNSLCSWFFSTHSYSAHTLTHSAHMPPSTSCVHTCQGFRHRAVF